MTRKFFFSCAGLLCLALAYHLGSSRAVAGPDEIVASSGYNCGAVAIVTNRVLYRSSATDLQPLDAPLPPIPGTSPVVWIDACMLVAVLANGDVYGYKGDWIYLGNGITNATPVRLESWGGVKSRYR